MKIIILSAVLFGLIFYLFNNKEVLNEKNIINSLSDNASFIQEKESFIFVPYWTFTSSLNVEKYDSIIYFGVSFDENGINRSDDGFYKLSSFSEGIPSGAKKYLTLRVLGEDSVGSFLEDVAFQRKVGTDLSSIAKNFGFDGVVIDYETSAFGFPSTEHKIIQMYTSLQEEIKKEGLEFLVVVFGDNYYRGRPYDIKKINSLSDKVIIMTYDFHKARLNPGPNFPLSDKEKYGYDLKTMIKDFEKDLDFEKIVIALGYFGYDWKLRDGVSVEMAAPLSLNQVNSRFINNCSFENCSVETNNDDESVVRYKDSEGFDHEVWFEDKKSVGKKIEFLNSVGIKQIGFWAYSFY